MNEDQCGWKFLDHTADIRMEVEGRDLQEFLKNAAFGLFAALSGETQSGPDKSMEIHVFADTLEELTINWLRELLFIHETQQLLVHDIHFSEASETEIAAELLCKSRNENDQPEVEIKGVTYHGFNVKRTGDGFQARIIFDI